MSVQVAAGPDDARQTAGGATQVSGVVIGVGAAGIWAGLRFVDVPLPPNSLISQAALRLKVTSTGMDDPDVNIYAEAADSAAIFEAVSGNISSRERTTAVATWTATAVGDGWQASVDIASVLQEVIARPGWQAGNAVAVLLEGRSTTTFSFYAYDNSAEDGAWLDVEFVAGDVAGSVVEVAAGDVCRVVLNSSGLYEVGVATAVAYEVELKSELI